MKSPAKFRSLFLYMYTCKQLFRVLLFYQATKSTEEEPISSCKINCCSTSSISFLHSDFLGISCGDVRWEEDNVIWFIFTITVNTVGTVLTVKRKIGETITPVIEIDQSGSIFRFTKHRVLPIYEMFENPYCFDFIFLCMLDGCLTIKWTYCTLLFASDLLNEGNIIFKLIWVSPNHTHICVVSTQLL